jgi:hypothetical protein
MTATGALRRTLVLAAVAALVLGGPLRGRATPSPCLPPGIASEVLTWETANAQAVAFPTESGGKRAGLLELYKAPDGRSVVVVWVQGDIVYVDSAPQDPETPGWVDAGFMTSNGKTLLDPPRKPCQWRVVNGTDV